MNLKPAARWQIAALAVVVCMAFALALAVAGILGPFGDLYPRWYGLRALFSGIDPYSDGVTREILASSALWHASPEPQGGQTPGANTAAPLEIAYGFLYPLPGALLLSPLALLPYPLAYSLWLLGSLITLPATALAAAGRRHPRLIVLPAVFLPALWNITLAQPGLAAVGMVGAALAVRSRFPAMAGALLAGACLLKPQILLPLAPYWFAFHLFHWVKWHKRDSRSLLLGGGATALALLTVATALLPTWPGSFLHAALAYRETPGMAPASSALATLFSVVLPGQMTSLFTISASGALLLWAALGFWVASSTPRERQGNLDSSASEYLIREKSGVLRGIVAGALIVPPAWETSSVLLLIPLAAVLGLLDGWRANVYLATVALLSSGLAPLSLVWPWRAGAVSALAFVLLIVAGEQLTRRLRSSSTPDAAAPVAQEPPGSR